MSKSRAGCSWMVVSFVAGVMAGGCTGGAGSGAGLPSGGSAPVAATLADPWATPATAAVGGRAGVRVGAGLEVQAAAIAATARFHASGARFTANGAFHRFEIQDRVVRVARVLTAAERRQLLVARARAGGPGGSAARPPWAVLPGTAAAPLSPAALELETLSVARAGYQCLAGAPTSSIDAAGTAQRRFATCTERWSNGARNGEVAFQFAQRPTGTGDLVVAMRAQIGAAAAPMMVDGDDIGLRLSTPAGDRFRFGHATWVDAAGTRTAVRARWDAGRISLTVPAAVVDGSRYPAVLDPVVGPDLGTDAPVLQPSSSGIEPEVASDGSDSLVVFSDFQRVRAVRVDPNGDVLDFDWLDLGEEGQLQFRPMVAFGGGRYLVVWWQGDGTTLSIRGRLVNPDGSLVGVASFPISSGEGLDPAITWTGQSFMVGWGGFGPFPGVRVALVSADGTVAAGSERQVSPTTLAFEQRMAAGATTVVVAWERQLPDDFSHLFIQATRLGLDGTVLDPDGIDVDPSATFQDQPAVGSNGHQFLVAWRRSADVRTIQGSVIDESGAITAAPFPISRSPSDVAQPAVASDGTQFLVAWQAQSDVNAVIAGAAVSAGGVVQGANDAQLAGVPSRAGADPTGLAWNGTQFLLAYDGLRASPDGFDVAGIDGSLVAPDLGITTDALAFSQLPNQQLSPHAVWDGVDYVVSWTDGRVPGFDQSAARAVRISSGGVVRDPAGIALSSPLSALNHRLASNGDRRSLAVWQTSAARGVVRSIAANGTLGPIRALAPGVLVSGPLLASNGATFLSTFARNNAAGTRTDLIGTFVAGNGNPGPLFTIRRASAPGSMVAAGDVYLVQSADTDGTNRILDVGPNGGVSAPLASPAGSATLVAASSNRNTLVSWVGPNGEVLAQFFARGAFRGTPLTISPTSDGFPPTIAFDGTRYWSVWAADFENERPMIRSIDVNGTMGGAELVADVRCESPELGSNGARQLLLTCFEFRNGFRVIRVTTRLIDTSSGPSVAAPATAAGPVDATNGPPS